MKIYSTSVSYKGRDTYDLFVVVANSKEEARLLVLEEAGKYEPWWKKSQFDIEGNYTGT